MGRVTRWSLINKKGSIISGPRLFDNGFQLSSYEKKVGRKRIFCYIIGF